MGETISPSALERLLESREQFLAFLRKRVDSPETAEDILQAAFVRGLERGGEIRDDESVVAWFYRVLRNAVIDHYRRRSAEERALESWTRETPEPQEYREVCGCLAGLIAGLKPEYRAALESVDLGEGTLRDLAAQAGISEGNAAVRVHRARQALKKEIQTSCGACAEHGCLDCSCRKTESRT